MQHSTLGMWASGKRRSPTIDYKATPNGAFEDVTAYDKQGMFSSTYSRDSVRGTNVWLDKQKLTFRWSLTGLLSWLKADCRVSELRAR